jgi:hypothetical protein
MGSERAVVVKGGDLTNREEFKSNGAITPGQLLEQDSAGDVKRHATAGGNQSRLFALEDYTWGKDIDDDYADNVQAQCIWARRGDVINALLADGQNVAIGDKAESAGDGDLQKHAADSGAAPVVPESIVGTFIEALDLSDSSGADPASRRVLVQID